MDAHALLGLPPDAGERDVKHAFRRLAMRWHPDRNADPAAVERFKQLRAAHDALLAQLAAGDEAGFESGAEADAEAAPPRRGAARRADLRLTLEEAFHGGAYRVVVEDRRPCGHCGGDGEEALAHTRLCGACHGTGRVRDGHRLERCEKCRGRGYVSRQPCRACDGTGELRTGRTVAVDVPPGVLDGDALRVDGAGEPAESPQGRPGDLLVTVRLAPHPLFRLDGRDLIFTRPVSALRMLLGGPLPVPLPGGVRHLKLEPGSPSPRELRVRGGGFPGRDGEPAGALLVRLVPVLPQAAGERMRPLLEALERELAAERATLMPDLAHWEARWLDGDPPE